MTGPPGGVPPPEKEAAAQGPTGAAEQDTDGKSQPAHHTKNSAERLLEMAVAVMHGGELREFVPAEPAWYRRIGAELFGLLIERREPDPRRRRQLELVYGVARARRDGAAMGPTYPRPTHESLMEARTALDTACDAILAKTLEYHAAVGRKAA
jgi:hypothetical protein